jgi:hypothetical protein
MRRSRRRDLQPVAAHAGAPIQAPRFLDDDDRLVAQGLALDRDDGLADVLHEPLLLGVGEYALDDLDACERHLDLLGFVRWPPRPLPSMSSRPGAAFTTKA